MSDDDRLPWWGITMVYAIDLVVGWLALKALCFFWGRYVLLDFDDLRAHGTSITEGLASVWFIFAWAAVITLVVGIALRNQPRPDNVASYATTNMWASVNAGFFEELIYRYVVFFGVMIILPFLNRITFGLMGWFYREALIPLANWATLGALEPQFHHANWVFAAAIVMAGASFRDIHKYQGFFGMVNSWFLGMVFFWLMFNYGIGTAMVAHILYDLIVDAAVLITFSWRERDYR